MFVLNPHSGDLRFPSAHLASPQGLLAIGGDLRANRLLEAYRQGIFPWYNEGQPILWWSPDPRTVLLPEKLTVSRSLKKTLRKRPFTITLDQDFFGVMRGCAGPRRQNPDGGTWITSEMLHAYSELHRVGYAHSVEAWRDDELVGGLYGVSLGGVFFGESMFSLATDASKVAFVYLVRQLQAWGCSLIDCQLTTEHLLRFGAEEIPRYQFLALLADALTLPDRLGPWQFELEPPTQ